MNPESLTALASIMQASTANIQFLELAWRRQMSRKQKPRFGGSRPGRQPNADRNFEDGTARIVRDYFSANPVYNDRLFRRRFRMQKSLFVRIMDGVLEQDRWFHQKYDRVTGKPGLSPLQKVVAAMRILAYGCASDACDEYVRIGESTANLALERFCQAVTDCFGKQYLRSPNGDDLEMILKYSQERGFPGMIGSIDCYAWKWEKCPSAFKGAYTGDKGTAVMLEAIVDHRTWVWHAFAGVPGSMNDINVLQRSSCHDDIIQEKLPEVEFTVNGKPYKIPYWLADGIYPEYTTFVKTIPDPLTADRKLFAKLQESFRKDVERFFGILQGRFAIVKRASRFWTVEKMVKIITACCILHNMIVEDEQETYHLIDFDSNRRRKRRASSTNTNDEQSFVMVRPERELIPVSLAKKIEHIQAIQDKAAHHQLKNDLVAHCWAENGRK